MQKISPIVHVTKHIQWSHFGRIYIMFARKAHHRPIVFVLSALECFFNVFLNFSEFVDMLLYFLTEDGDMVDGTQFQEIQVSSLEKYVNVTKSTGGRYQITRSTDFLEERLHFSVVIQGVVLNQDLPFLTRALFRSWNTTLRGRFPFLSFSKILFKDMCHDLTWCLYNISTWLCSLN